MVRKLLFISTLLLASCAPEARSSWDYQAGFCKKHPECRLKDRLKRSPLYNPSIYIWITNDTVFMESEFYIPEYQAVLYIYGESCYSNQIAIYEDDIVPYDLKCKLKKKKHHSSINHIYVSVEGHDTYDCHFKPQLSTQDISIYRCQMET